MENIFNVVVDDTPTVDESIDYVEAYVGENKKFKDVAGLARGKAEADKYIEVLKTKLDELGNELKTRTSLDAFLTEIKASKEPVPNSPITPQGGQDNGRDDSDLEAKLEALLAQREAKSASESNINKVTRVLQEQFGDQASIVINNKAKELAMSPQQLQSIATSSPAAFFRLVGVSETAPPGQAPVAPRSGVNSAATAMNGSVRNKAYYEKMKQTDPVKYFSGATTTAMMRDRAALGSNW